MFKTLKRQLAQLLGVSLIAPAAIAADVTLLNAAYDVSRDVYRDLNPVFAAEWAKTNPGSSVKVDQSHGGSSKQARAVIDGLQADILATNNPLDVDAVVKAGLLSEGWAQRLPHGASPSWSTILFLVRKGNPKGIRDWDDLVKPGVGVIIPNPKTSGNGRYSYLAAWQYALSQPGGSEQSARDFAARFVGNVPVLDTGGRGATTTFVQRGIGDVLLTFENELVLLKKEFGADAFEIVVPSLSIRADNPIAVVEKVAERKKTTAAAHAYAQFHFSKVAQEIFAANGLRPADEEVLARHPEFARVNLFVIDDWAESYAKHFADGGTFDQVYSPKK